MADERDWEQEWLERMSDENHEEIAAKTWKVLEEERGHAQALRDNQNHRATVEAYDAVKRAFFTNTVDDKTLERVRRGDHQAEQDLLVQLGVVDDLKRSE
jgi:hypothetical protein